MRAAILAAALATVAGGPAFAQLSPIVAATQVPGIPVAPYGVPYGVPPYVYGGYPPYQTQNPGLNPLTQGQPNPNIAPRAGATPMQGLLGGMGGGGQGGGGQGGGGQAGGQGGSPGGGNAGLSAPDPATSYELLQDPGSPVFGRYGALQSKNGDLRQQVLAQAARGVGIRQGFAEETARLNAELDGAYGAELDRRYDFGPLMIERTLVPPVITELHRLAERVGDRTLYLTLGAFEIVRPARLALRPPDWRDYLYNTGVPPAPPGPAAAVRPEDSTEEGVWGVALEAGLAVGITEARASFAANFNRLDRDFTGMGRYHDLARSGAVSLPTLSRTHHPVRVAAGGERAFVGERVIHLTVSPKFRAAPPAAFR
ncbi:Type IV secretory system, conjugal DNA-protein transfer [Methylobacterium sp. ap11]|uniref:type IV secretory system conjugative DNA transfer family protein n=1 Tax=Methylobacterium sp. ap11 TaxID=1761799 RepID=UPI0008D467AB|nr:type IV secretory system conjugative DNA transfer family protein [Methylobacterium sp. ap11]SEP41369.1 Type IV secretory system, conjugal DNA-protein transfer [Methylobacterium sp. ap11]